MSKLDRDAIVKIHKDHNWLCFEPEVARGMVIADAGYQRGQEDERERAVAAIRSLRLRSVVLRDFLDEYGRIPQRPR